MFTATKDDIKSDIKTGAARIGNDVRQTANNVRSDLRKSNVEDAAYDIGQKAHDYLDRASHEIHDASNRVTSRIQSNPVESTVIALAVGFLFGLAFRR